MTAQFAIYRIAAQHRSTRRTAVRGTAYIRYHGLRWHLFSTHLRTVCLLQHADNFTSRALYVIMTFSCRDVTASAAKLLAAFSLHHAHRRPLLFHLALPLPGCADTTTCHYRRASLL